MTERAVLGLPLAAAVMLDHGGLSRLEQSSAVPPSALVSELHVALVVVLRAPSVVELLSPSGLVLVVPLPSAFVLDTVPSPRPKLSEQPLRPRSPYLLQQRLSVLMMWKSIAIEWPSEGKFFSVSLHFWAQEARR